MTGVQTERPGAPEVGFASEVDDETAVSRDRARLARGLGPTEEIPRRKFRGTGWFAVASLLCIGLLSVMLWQGWETAKEVKGGNRLRQQNNKTQPGYQEEVASTPSRLIGQLDADGHLADLVLLTAPDVKGGNAVFIPGTLVVSRDGQALRLDDIYEKSGWPSVVDSVGRFLGAGFTQTAVMTSDDAQKLLASAGPLAVNNTDPVVLQGPNGARTTVFNAGPLSLNADSAVQFMTVTGVGESPVQRSGRQQLVWQAWLDALAKDPSKLPRTPALGQGDGAIDMSGVVKEITSAPVSAQQVPVIRIPLPGGPGWAPDPASMPGLVAQMLPFPTSSFPGQRARVRILDGTTDYNLVLKATEPVVAAGGQVTIIGNADRFGVTTTKIEYHDPSQQAAADAIAKAMGNRQAVKSTDQTDAFDVTVTLGSDLGG